MTDGPAVFNTSMPARLGYGAMRHPSDPAEIRRMIDAFMNGGFNYFDTAHAYKDSEEDLKRDLTRRYPRSDYVLADKLPLWSARGANQHDQYLRESLKRCGVDYFDCYLLHSLDPKIYRHAYESDAFAWVVRQKEKGLCRHIGFSFHGGAELLEKILTDYPAMEFVQLQLNYMDVLRGSAGELRQIAIKHKKPIIAMEPIKGGTLASLPPAAEAILKAYAPDRSPASWAMRYTASLEGVTHVLSGMSSLTQVQDNVRTFTPFSPLNKEEYTVLNQALDVLSQISAVPCTACKYCVGECPKQIDIPVCFSLYNESKRGGELWNRQSQYRAISKGRAEDCIACGACLPRCPQHIDIPKELAAAAKVLS